MWLWIALILGCGEPLPVPAQQPGPSDTSVAALPTGTCRAPADCSTANCMTPGDESCATLVAECTYDSDCGTDGYCGASDPDYDSCKSTVCRTVCTSDAGCRAGAEVCDAGTGRCIPRDCESGYACPTFTTCVPGSLGHGCARDTCAADADCGIGFCVMGYCFDQPGTCG